MGANLYAETREASRNTGPTPWNKQPGRTTRLSDAERQRLRSSYVSPNDPRINDVGGQFSFNALASAINNAAAPQNNPQPPGAPPRPPAGPGGGGGGRGGGGGGGGLSQAQLQDQFNKYAAKVVANMGGMWASKDKLSPFINQAVDRDLQGVKDAFGRVGPATGNAYEGQNPFTPTSFNPAISNMMASQGLGGEFGDLAQAAGQAGLNGNADLWSGLNEQLARNQNASNAAWNRNLEADQSYATAGIEAQRAALLAAAQQRQLDKQDMYRDKRQQTILDLLGTGFNSGMDVSGIDFLSLLAAPKGYV